MNIKQRIAAVVVVIMGAGMLSVGSAAACTPGVSTGCTTLAADLTALTSIRVLTSVTPAVTFSNAVGATMTGAVVAVITESLAIGDSPWSVKAQLDGNKLSAVTGTATIAGQHMTITPTSVATSVGGSGTLTLGSTLGLDAERTIFTNTGQVAANRYNEVYTASSTLSLSIPSGTTNQLYNGTLIVTLYQ
jgi:hypothetical protein